MALHFAMPRGSVSGGGSGWGYLSKYKAPPFSTRMAESYGQKFAAPGVAKLRGGLSQALLQSGYAENPNVAAMQKREALAGFGTGLSEVIAGGQRVGLSAYQQKYGAEARAAAESYRYQMGREAEERGVLRAKGLREEEREARIAREERYEATRIREEERRREYAEEDRKLRLEEEKDERLRQLHGERRGELLPRGTFGRMIQQVPPPQSVQQQIPRRVLRRRLLRAPSPITEEAPWVSTSEQERRAKARLKVIQSAQGNAGQAQQTITGILADYFGDTKPSNAWAGLAASKRRLPVQSGMVGDLPLAPLLT